MMRAIELKKWVATLNDDDIIGIDDGGLTIKVADNDDVYIELGGISDLKE